MEIGELGNPKRWIAAALRPGSGDVLSLSKGQGSRQTEGLVEQVYRAMGKVVG